MRNVICTILILTYSATAAVAQEKTYLEGLPYGFDFFGSTEPLEMVFETDLKVLFDSDSTKYQDGVVEIEIKNTTFYRSAAGMKVRGQTRKQVCPIPPIKVNLKKSTIDESLESMDKLDIVNTCFNKEGYTQYLYKEYLAYKLYNIITDFSYRVRLLDVTYVDSEDGPEIVNRPGFLIESDKEMEERLNAKEKGKKPTQGELIHNFYTSPDSTNQFLVTRLALFQYMIGNTDWAIHSRHNCKTFKKNDRIYPVPYDFDYSGFVNTPYAVPSDSYNLDNVRQRFYQGSKVSKDIFDGEVRFYISKKEEILSTVSEFSSLSEKERSRLNKYLEKFFEELVDGTLAEKIVETSS